MPLDPQVARLLDLVRRAARPDYWEMTPQEARAVHERNAPAFDIAPQPVARVFGRTAPGPRGDVPIRVYVPREAAQPLPLLVWMHGGGHMVGSLDGYDALCRALALRADCIVASVDYRLAPEHRFPAGVEDCEAAMRWAVARAAALGADASRVAVGGDSAGGNYAAVCAILARDSGIPLAHQLLVYPRTASREDSASHLAYAEGHLLTRRTILWFHEHYRSGPDDHRDFRYAPLDCPDLGRLAPALLIVGECDPLRDEGVAYARRLEAAGNAVELVEYPGMVHGFLSMGRVLDAGRDAIERAAGSLRQAFAAAPRR